MSRYDDYIMRGKMKHNEDTGNVFDESGLDAKFIPAFNSGERVRVKFSYGEVRTGTIGVTTGWRPCFLLMVRRTSIGSSYTLGSEDNFTTEKCGYAKEAI